MNAPTASRPSASRDAAGSLPSPAILRARRERAAVTREALTLPLIFLTVALLGGVRVTAGTGHLLFQPPSLMALVLALLLCGALVRCGALAPDRLVDASRTGLANASGIVVLVTLFAACAQAFHLTTPDSGLLQFLFNAFFLLLLWNTMAAQPDRRRLLSSLMVLFGGAFVLRYVLLAALYDPQGGVTKRVLTAMLEGVTLGGLAYVAPAPATGYLAFFALLLFLIGLSLLPAARPAAASQRRDLAVTRRQGRRARGDDVAVADAVDVGLADDRDGDADVDADGGGDGADERDGDGEDDRHRDEDEAVDAARAGDRRAQAPRIMPARARPARPDRDDR